MAGLAVASTAAAAAAFSYLDAKFHLRKDWKVVQGNRKARELMQEAVRARRLSLYYLFEAKVQRKAEAECIWWRQRSYTWAETYHRANQYGRFFLDQGVRPGQLVALFMANSPDFVFAWLGLWAIGASPALINHHLSKNALLHCLAICQATLVLADGRRDLLARMDEVRHELADRAVQVLTLDELRPELDAKSGQRPPNELRDGVMPNSPFALFYTSGTTGMPKACVIPVAAGFTAGVGRVCGTAFIDKEGERYYDCMPLYHGTGGVSGMTQLLTGTTLCLAPKFSSSRFWDDVRDSGATWFAYVGETVRYLLAAPPSARDRDHGVHSMYGNGLRPDVWKAFRDRFGIETIHEFFNSTEGVLTLANPCRGDFFAHAVGHHGLVRRRQLHHVFIPVATDAESGALLRDPRTGFAQRVPYHLGGEILVAQSTGLAPDFPGYVNDEAATEKMYVHDVFRKGDRYYRTGDALRRDGDGRWFFLDRLGDSFRWKGENVSTAEVSQVLGQFPGVAEAAVYGVALPGHDGKAGMAAIFAEPWVQSLDYAGLLRYAVPVFIRHVKERSSTHNNKQNKVPLKKEGVDPAKVQGDALLWIGDNGKGSTYVPFGDDEWDALKQGRAKL